MPAQPRSVTWSAGAIGPVALLGAAALALWEPWHGPIVLSLSAGHGLAAGDSPALLLLALAAALVLPRVRRRPGGWHGRATSALRRSGSLAAVVLGILLLAVGATALGERGSLVPAGGVTLDGTVEDVAGRAASPAGRWSHLALTYDGATLRLFVDGTPVSSRAATGTGTVEPSGNAVWIGGNDLYGEHFAGEIDEARIYDRALGGFEVRADMATPVASAGPAHRHGRAAATPPGRSAPVAGLVGAYSFDAGSGTALADASGHGNTGEIIGATWTTRGRYGGALTFDGADAVVRIPPSDSLAADSALTLSAWVRPAGSQSGWRTVVQREPDAYFLTASSDLAVLDGRADDVLAGSVVVAAAWLALALARRPGPRAAWWRGWPGAVGMVLAGLAVDAAVAPAPTVLGPIMLAVWFARRATRRGEAVAGWLVAALLAGATVASVAELPAVAAPMRADDGGLARSAALGTALLVTGLVGRHRQVRARTAERHVTARAGP